jgi:hypothetical protein
MPSSLSTPSELGWVCSAILQEMRDGLGGGDIYFVGLRGCRGAKGDEEGGIDGASVVQERAEDMLEFGEAHGFRG